ncbi:Down Syndrome Cell Adhesion Molecule [Manis pentadactyla]|nr:Down Syndrome Cell Adhesion Molecule [Manis pentadactyla]
MCIWVRARVPLKTHSHPCEDDTILFGGHSSVPQAALNLGHSFEGRLLSLLNPSAHQRCFPIHLETWSTQGYHITQPRKPSTLSQAVCFQ